MFATIGLKDNDFTSGIKKAKDEFEGFGKSTSNVGANIGKVILGMGAAVGALAGAAIKLGSEFGAQMSRVGAISGATGKDFEKLRAQAIQLGADTAFSAKEAAAGMENLASAGFDAAEIMAAMPGILDLAAVSGGDVALASENAASALRAFGLDASEAGHIADVFARAAADTNAEVYDMGEALKYVAPNAKTAGISLEETAAAIGIMSDAGVKGSQAGTTLRTALVNMAKPTDKMQGKMDELGLSFFDTNGEMVSLEEQVRQLEGAFASLTPQQRQNALATLYGKEALSGMTILIERGSAELGTLTHSLENSTGAADEMAKIIQDNLMGDVEELGGSLETLGIQIFSHFDKPLREAAQEGSKAINNLSKEMAKPDMSKAIDTIANGFSGLIKIIGNIITAVIPSLVSGLSSLISVIMALSPLLISLAAGFALYTVITTVTTALKGITAGFQAAQVQLALYMMTQKSSTIATVADAAALTAKEVIVALLTGKMGFATSAQWLWNAAMAANPIGLIIAGVALLIGGIIALVSWINRETEEEKALKKSIDDTVESNKALISSMEESENAHNKNIDSIDAEVFASQKLADKVFELAAVENKTAEQKRELAVYTDMLNESMEGLNLQYDAENDLLSQTQEEINGIIAARGEQMKAQAAQERAIEIAKEQFEIEQQLNDIARQKAEAQELYGEGTNKYNKVVKDLVTTEDELTASLASNSEAFDNLTEVVVENEKVQVEAATNVGQTWVAMNGEIMASQDELEKRNEKILDLIDDYVSAVTDMYTTIDEKAKASVEEQLATLDANYEASQRFTENLNTLMERGLDEAIIDNWREAGLGSAGEVEQWANATDEEIVALNEKMARNVEEGARGAGESLKLIAEESMDGFIAGVEDGLPDVTTAGEEAGDALTDGAKNSLEVHSPSRVFIEIGKNTMDGLANGIKDNAKVVTTALDELIKKVKETLTKVAPEKHNLDTWTKSVNDTATKGMNDLQTTVKTKAGEVPNQMYTALQPAIGRVTEWFNQLINEATTKSNQFVETTVKIFATLPQKIYDAIAPTKEKIISWGNEIKNLGDQAGKGFVATTIDAIKDLPTKFKKPLDDVIIEVKKWVTSLNTTAKTEIPKFVTTSTDEMKKLLTAMPPIGVQIVEGLWSGMNSKLSWFKSQIASFVQAAIKTMKSELDINSPSRVTAEIGRFTVEGFIVGIQSMAKTVEAAIEDVFSVDETLIPEFALLTNSDRAEGPEWLYKCSSGLTLNQYLQTVEQTPYEAQQASIAGWQRALWGV